MKHFFPRTSILVIKTVLPFSIFLLSACGASKQAAETSTATSTTQSQNKSVAEQNGVKPNQNVQGTENVERVKLNKVY